MKKKNIGVCKYDRCQREYDRDEVARSYGALSDVFLLGYCSPYCYTRDNVKEIVVVLKQKGAGSFKRKQEMVGRIEEAD